MVNPKVSVIIPFYNPKNYFHELLESIANQTYKNIQIVLIDDGSDEIYNNIAKEFVSLSDDRVLITTDNFGVASARQTGLEASTGDLIIHADADDSLPKHAIQRMVEKMIATNSDLVIAGYVMQFKNKEQYIGINENETYWGFVEGLLSCKYHGSLCNKLIKKELYKSIEFEPQLNYMEDKLLLAKILRFGPYRISFLDEPVYFYRQNSGSITYNLSLDSINSSTAVIDKIADIYENIFPDDFINYMIKQQRVFEIFLKAKLGINAYSAKDAALLKDDKIQFKYKIVLWLVSKNFVSLVQLVSKTKSMLMSLHQR